MSYIHELELLSCDPSEGGCSDMWKWAIYVALASPLPPSAASSTAFDREAIVKQILMRHVTYSPANPFAIPSIGGSGGAAGVSNVRALVAPASSFASVASKASLPSSLPILRAEDAGLFAISLSQDQSAAAGLAVARASAPSSSTVASAAAAATESFLLGRLQLPVSWLHACKAIRAHSNQDYSVACFHYLHAGDIAAAYGIWERHLRDIWILLVISRQEGGADAEPASSSPSSSSSSVSSLASSLLQLLQLFHAHSATLHGWNESGALLLSFLEMRRNFAANLAHFTYATASASTSAPGAAASLSDDHATRSANFRSLQKEMQGFLATLDRVHGSGSSGAASAAAAGVAHPQLALLAFSKMSGSILAHLHALQPLEEEMRAAAAAGAGDESALDATVDVSAGELVSSADRLAVLSDWKDQWLATQMQQFNAAAVESQ